MASLKGLFRRIARLFDSGVPPVDSELADREAIFRAPPLTSELITAVKLISPHFQAMKATEQFRTAWERDQNASCWGEYLALQAILEVASRGQRILEIGPGLGRSLVFFSQMLSWQDKKIHVFEGEGTETNYTILGPRFEDSYCGNFEMLKYVLEFNGIDNVEIFDAKTTPLHDLPGSYDLIYGFYSIGFHWSLEHFLDDILSLMSEESLAVFTVPEHFEPFPAIEELSHRVITWKASWPPDAQQKMLIFSRQPSARVFDMAFGQRDTSQPG